MKPKDWSEVEELSQESYEYIIDNYFKHHPYTIDTRNFYTGERRFNNGK